MSKVAATYKSMGTYGRSNMENTLRAKTIIIPRSSNAGHLEDEFIQNVMRYRAMRLKLKEDVPAIVIYQASSRIKDEEKLIVDTLRGFLSAIFIIASVGKDSEVSIVLPSFLNSTVKQELRLFIKNGHILPNDMDNENTFRCVLNHCCQPDPLTDHWKKIAIAVSVMCFLIIIVALSVRFA